VAIATFNSESVIGNCLQSIASDRFDIVLFDDGSSDATVAVAQALYPDLIVLRGDGSNWWAGGTVAAVEKALAIGCEFVVLLNPDVTMTAADVEELVRHVEGDPQTIVAPLVVDRSAPDQVAWAGSRFGPIGCLPVYTSRYVAKPGTLASQLGSIPYEVDEVHGRGTVLSRAVISKIGLLDATTFPHYGADNDYSWRARRAGVQLKVVPSVRVRLAVENSGMRFNGAAGLRTRAESLYRYLLDRKSGEALRVWWRLMSRHVPVHAVIPSFLFNILLNVARKLRSTGNESHYQK
jgi:hypothetical protein